MSSNNWIWAAGFLALVVGGIAFGARAGVDSGREALRLETVSSKTANHADADHAPTPAARKGAHPEDADHKPAQARAVKAPAELELVKGNRAEMAPRPLPTPRLELWREPSRPSGRLMSPASRLDVAFATGRIDNLPGRPAPNVIIPPKPPSAPMEEKVVAAAAAEAPPAAPEAPAAPEPETPKYAEAPVPTPPEAPSAPAVAAAPEAPASDVPEAPEAPAAEEAEVVEVPEAALALEEPVATPDPVKAPEAAPSESAEAPAPEAVETADQASETSPDVEKSTEVQLDAAPSPAKALDVDDSWTDETEDDTHPHSSHWGSVDPLEFVHARM